MDIFGCVYFFGGPKRFQNDQKGPIISGNRVHVRATSMSPEIKTMNRYSSVIFLGEFSSPGRGISLTPT